MLTVWNAVSWLKDALASRELVEHLTHYYLRDNRLYASDGRIMASIPCEIVPAVAAEGPVLVPGKEFERLLKAMRPDRPVVVTRQETGVQLSQGRFKAVVPTVDPSAWPYDAHDSAALVQMPETFLEGLRRLRPFVSDNATQPWATCVQIESDGMLATNNIVIARAVCSLAITGAYLLPAWGVDFLLSHTEGFVGGRFTDDAAHFEWANGGRMRTQLVTGAFPERAKAMCRPTVGTRTPLTVEWREVYARIAVVANGGPVSCRAEHLETGGRGDSLRCEDGAETPVPSSGASVWSERHLTPVVDQAEWWTPELWPSPAAWGRNDGSLFGILAGLREA